MHPIGIDVGLRRQGHEVSRLGNPWPHPRDHACRPKWRDALDSNCGSQRPGIARMSYYDIDSILTDAQVSSRPVFKFSPSCSKAHTLCQKLPCTFELEVPGLGILEGNPGEDVGFRHQLGRIRVTYAAQIKTGTRIDLPLWLGEMLSIG